MSAPELHPLAAEVQELLNGHDQDFLMMVTFIVQPGEAAKFRQAFQQPLLKTVQEAGNISYRLAQQANAPEQFLVIEHWKNLAALNEHLHQPYLTQLLDDVGPLLTVPPALQILTEVQAG